MINVCLPMSQECEAMSVLTFVSVALSIGHLDVQ